MCTMITRIDPMGDRLIRSGAESRQVPRSPTPAGRLLVAPAGVRGQPVGIRLTVRSSGSWRPASQTGWHIPLREPGLERGGLPIDPSPARSGRRLGSRVRRSRFRAELQLHRHRTALARLHCRCPTREFRPAPLVQSTVRAVRRPCRFRVAAVLAETAGRSGTVAFRERDLCGVREGRPESGTVRTQSRGRLGSPDDETRLCAVARRQTRSRVRI